VTGLLELLEALCPLPAPSGHEGPVRDWLLEAWRPAVRSIDVDPIGNVVACVGGTGPRAVVTAHMDEIGWVVRSITDEGFLLLDGVPGLRRDGPSRWYPVGQAVKAFGRDGPVASGLLAAAAGHVVSSDPKLRRHEALGWSDFFVDLGVGSRAEVDRLGVHIGAPVVFENTPRKVGGRIVGKSMDDRLPLAVMTQLLERVDPDALTHELWFAATVQEETGLHGAQAVVTHASFDYAIALDVGLVGDIPTVDSHDYPARLGGGPTVVHRDSKVVYDPALSWRLIEAAATAGVPAQHGVYGSYGSDGVPFVQAGIPTSLVGIPTRYTHTAFEMIDPADAEGTARMLEALVTS
jgi:tetrahedral aminopeptidase